MILACDLSLQFEIFTQFEARQSEAKGLRGADLASFGRFHEL